MNTTNKKNAGTLCALLGNAKEPHIKAPNCPHYRKWLSSPPIDRDQKYRVTVEETGEVIYRYTPPPPPKRPRPITPWIGSWAQQEEQRRMALAG